MAQKTQKKTKKDPKTDKKSNKSPKSGQKRNKGGRPTKYKKKMVKMVNEYVDITPMPFKEELCLNVLEINGDTLVQWVKKHDEFSAAIKRLEDKQKYRLQGMGLTGQVNTTMAIFLLKANHGLVDKVVAEHTGKDGGPIQTEDVGLENYKDYQELLKEHGTEGIRKIISEKVRKSREGRK